jgi:hypothetical protein
LHSLALFLPKQNFTVKGEPNGPRSMGDVPIGLSRYTGYWDQRDLTTSFTFMWEKMEYYAPHP